MKMQPDMDPRMEALLESLAGIQRATPRPYLFTRIRARMQKEVKSVWETMGSYLARPVVVVSGLCMVFILNAFILFKQGPGEAPVSSAGQNEQLITDNEYILASGSSFDYENMVQQ